jgi:hypothetical protein
MVSRIGFLRGRAQRPLYSIKVFKREPLGSGVIIAELSYYYLNSGTILSS